MKLSTLLASWLSNDVPNIEITGIHHDSRQIKSGYLFLAYPGQISDGRDYIERAIQAGAVAVVYESTGVPLVGHSVPCIPMVGLSKLMPAIASKFYDYPSQKLNISGVTGTNGKTTIAFQLSQAYALLGRKAVYIGTLGHGSVDALQTLNNTTPDALCLQQLFSHYQQQGIEEVCMEVSSHGLSQQRVSEVNFTQAIYTNLSHDHLDYHHTMEAYAQAKALLFAFPSVQCAIINRDDAYADLMLQSCHAGCKKITYGLNNNADVQASSWQTSQLGSQIEVNSPWGSYRLEVNLPGVFNIYNSLAIFSSLVADGFTPQDVVDVMRQLKSSSGRMEIVAKKPCVVVDYAHTPDALKNALMTLKALKQKRLGVVFGCGGDRDKTKRPEMGKIASEYADFIIITSDNPRSENPAAIIHDIVNGLPANAMVLTIEDRAEAIAKAIEMAGEDDIILIAGKGHESYQQIGDKKLVFSDQAVVRSLLSK